MNDSVYEILSTISEAEKAAAGLMLHAQGTLAEIKTSRRDVVTEYDRRVQQMLVRRLRDAVPEAHFFCEEKNVQENLKAEHVFIIDPIDGTMNFVHNMHHSCISVAYMSYGVILAASVYNPYTDEMFTAAKGSGAFINGRPIRVENTPLSDSLFCMGSAPYEPQLADETFRLARIAYDASLDLRRFASAELDLCAVAAGRAGLYFELSVSFWDYAAGSLILTEAGGVCSTIDGASLPLDGRKTSILAGNRQAYKDFAALIAPVKEEK